MITTATLRRRKPKHLRGFLRLRVFLETGFDHQTKIVDETGQVLSRVSEDGDGLTVSEITLADTKPVPQQAQPRMQTLPFVYFISDVLPRWALGGLYKQYING
jgi:hypothetical protein